MRVFGKHQSDYQDYLSRKRCKEENNSYKDYYNKIRTPPICKPSPMTIDEGLYSICANVSSKQSYPYGIILYKACTCPCPCVPIRI